MTKIEKKKKVTPTKAVLSSSKKKITTNTILPEEYAYTLINSIKQHIQETQIKATLSANKELIKQPQSDMAQQSFKDPYLFDFLTLREDFLERDLELGLIEHIQKFLLELGEGFAFIGRQHHLSIGNNDYYIDLLFYHVKLRCYIVIELKATAFKPEYTGMLNFYLSAVDDLLRHPDDKPTIGLLLCKTKDNFTAEYALRDINKPIGVAGYETILVESLPKNLKGSLPSIEDIEHELETQKALMTLQTKKIKRTTKE